MKDGTFINVKKITKSDQVYATRVEAVADS